MAHLIFFYFNLVLVFVFFVQGYTFVTKQEILRSEYAVIKYSSNADMYFKAEKNIVLTYSQSQKISFCKN